MAYEIFIGNKQGLEDRLNNVLVLGPILESGLPVGGKTLEFTSPLTTVTFSGALGDMRTVSEIVSELSAVAGLVVSKRRDQNAGNAISSTLANGAPDPAVLLAMNHASGFTIGSTGTANADFKLSTTTDTVRAAPVAIAKIGGFTVDAPGFYTAVIDLT